MGIFERFGRSARNRADEEHAKLEDALGRARAAEQEVNRATRQRAYAAARATELLPLLREKAQTEMEVAAARRGLESRRQYLTVIETAQNPKATGIAAIKRQAESDLKTAEATYQQLAAQLDGVSLRLHDQDRAIRERIGIGLPDRPGAASSGGHRT